MAQQEQRLLAVFAHPDDEQGLAGTMALYAAQGVEVHLICATSGEVGKISDPSLATPDNLGLVRQEELREAARILGIQEPVFLGYRDSGMAGTSDNNHPTSLNRADPKEVVGKLVLLMRQLQPQVVVTFDDTGVYGHPDHVAVHRFTAEAFSQAGRPERYPEQLVNGLKPFSPQRLYYSAFPRSVVCDLVSNMKSVGASMPADFPPVESIGSPDGNLTTAINVSPYVEAKQRAVAAHRTQQGDSSPFDKLPQAARDAFLRTEFFHRAQPPPDPDLWESGLF